MFLRRIVFSSFLVKELKTAKNIKNRINRHNVCKILKCLSEKISSQSLEKGLMIYTGIDEYDKLLLHFIIPEIKLNIFYYNCGDRFNTEIAHQYLKKYDGNVIFANGLHCLIYSYNNGTFVLNKQINAHLQKRQKKGGQSAIRIARLAEETRYMYVVRIVEYVNKLNTDGRTALLGSSEITEMVMKSKILSHEIIYLGFLDFNKSTILDTRKWCKVLEDENKYDNFYNKIILYLDTDIEKLDFDIDYKLEMKFYVGDGGIPFPENESKYYSRLCGFNYIGVKYFNYENFID